MIFIYLFAFFSNCCCCFLHTLQLTQNECIRCILLCFLPQRLLALCITLLHPFSVSLSVSCLHNTRDKIFEASPVRKFCGQRVYGGRRGDRPVLLSKGVILLGRRTVCRPEPDRVRRHKSTSNENFTLSSMRPKFPQPFSRRRDTKEMQQQLKRFG